MTVKEFPPSELMLLTGDQRERDIITFVEKEFPTVIGIMIVGSAAHSQLGPDSDYDFSVVHDNYKKLLSNSTLLQEGEYRNIGDPSEFDILAVKTTVEETEVGVQIITREAFDRVCSLQDGNLSVFRPKPWDEYDYGRSSSGQEIAVRPRADQLPTGGCRLFLPITTEYNGQVFTGVHVHMFLANPRVIRDQSGEIARRLDDLWVNFLALLESHINEPNGVSLAYALTSLWKSEQFNSATIQHVEREIKQYQETK